MRKIDSSGKTECTTRFSSRAEAGSCPNGFSITTRASLAVPDRPRLRITVSNSDVEVAPLAHRIESRKDLLVREVASRTEEDERVGASSGFGHGQALAA